jgi:hypothetical protein
MLCGHSSMVIGAELSRVENVCPHCSSRLSGGAADNGHSRNEPPAPKRGRHPAEQQRPSAHRRHQGGFDISRYNAFRARAVLLARSGKFRGWATIQAELLAEGFAEAAEWLRPANLRTELDRLCAGGPYVKPLRGRPRQRALAD